MTVDKQPRALYLADVLAAGFQCDQEWYEIESAKELRRLHAENADFRATCDHLTKQTCDQLGEIVALKEQRDELVEALKKIVNHADAGTAAILNCLVEEARTTIAKATGETK